ncbi:unnamed protein product [Paramecium octaurelia]|uniref:Cilia- and flagella-associated protein 300 n=1 Tax=Paramecium octaurelia TaxID=43137 RepID=A0A8S1TTL4_PAROT|nr:unnamed protein product [Paramecium octaurelia]
MQIESDNQVTNQSYSFFRQENTILDDKKFMEILLKWGLQHSFKVSTFLFDIKFDHLNPNQFLLDLFNSKDVRGSLHYVSFKQNVLLSQIKFQLLTCKSIKLDLFDKLTEDKIVVKGHIKQCFEEQFENIQIADELRKALVLEDSEQYCVFNEADRQELLFKLFQILVLGGQLCQYEDEIQAYLDWTKYLYKNTVNARKYADKDEIYIDSYAYDIRKLENSYSSDHPQNVMYVVVNPSLRIVNIIENQWLKVW